MPFEPILQARANMVGPSPSVCSLNRMPGPALRRRKLNDPERDRFTSRTLRNRLRTYLVC